MLVNKKLIEKTIKLREQKNDFVKEFATRNKISSINQWSEFEPYTKDDFQKIYNNEIDGVKLKFRYTTLTINGRHRKYEKNR